MAYSGKLLAYVRACGSRVHRIDGPILEATGTFADEVREYGNDLDDHFPVDAPRVGLLVLEGDVEFDIDGEARMVGQWRELAQDELSRLGRGEKVLTSDKEQSDG